MAKGRKDDVVRTFDGVDYKFNDGEWSSLINFVVMKVACVDSHAENPETGEVEKVDLDEYCRNFVAEWLEKHHQKRRYKRPLSMENLDEWGRLEFMQELCKVNKALV